MIITGRITRLMEPVRGISQRTGAEWARRDIVIEYKENEASMFYDRVALTIMGNDRIEKLEVGQLYEVAIEHDVREYNGRVFNELRVRSFRKIYEPQVVKTEEEQQPEGETAPEPELHPFGQSEDKKEGDEKESDLPF